MYSHLPPAAQADCYLLFRSFAEMKLEMGDRNAALNILAAAADKAYATPDANTPNLPPTRIVKCKKVPFIFISLTCAAVSPAVPNTLSLAAGTTLHGMLHVIRISRDRTGRSTSSVEAGVSILPRRKTRARRAMYSLHKAASLPHQTRTYTTFCAA